jgi:hypothetical protein
VVSLSSMISANGAWDRSDCRPRIGNGSLGVQVNHVAKTIVFGIEILLAGRNSGALVTCNNKHGSGLCPLHLPN